MADDDALEKRKEEIIAAFRTLGSTDDDFINASMLATVLKGIDGDYWSEERAVKLMDGAGSEQKGQIRIRDLVSWLFKSEKDKQRPKVATGRPAGLQVAAANPEGYKLRPAFNEQDDMEPCSPKVPVRKRQKEKRANVYVPASGEQLFCPESHPSGMLLLRSHGNFAYVHDGAAKFSEGVSGEWTQVGEATAEGENTVKLQPRAFGYCYEESFDATEILGLCPLVKLCPKRKNDAGISLCTLPPELTTAFSWMDPTKEEALGFDQVAEVEPSSPKVFRKSKSFQPEARAFAYVPKDGEQLYRPQSNSAGLLLIRSIGSFAYVHDDQAKFSEGVQGEWRNQEASMVRLEPKSLGWCYEGRFDMSEITTACYTVTLCAEELDADGKQACKFPDEIVNKCTWLHPTLETTPPGSSIGCPEEGGGASDAEPTSPKIPRGKRRHPEKRAHAYQPGNGEELLCPKSRLKGMLLLRAEGTFSYVHDSMARFSEGVQGSWSLREKDQVMLRPDSFGWCYEESFDACEIVGVCHTVTLHKDEILENGKAACSLSDECLAKFSWLDPSLPEA